jgi:hypothetical protein
LKIDTIELPLNGERVTPTAYKYLRPFATFCFKLFALFANQLATATRATRRQDVARLIATSSPSVYEIVKDLSRIFQGTRLNAACDANEVFVWIGNSSCKVNSIDSSTLYCSPPAVQPLGLSESGRWDARVLPVVRVRAEQRKISRSEMVKGKR